VWTTDLSNQIIIAFSSVSIFQVQLPSGDDPTSIVHLIVNIRDQLDCITEYNMSSVVVLPDSEGIDDLINSLPNQLTNNRIVQLLASGNQNTVGQVLISLSQQLNKMNLENLDEAVSSRVSIFISIREKNLFSFNRWNTSCNNFYLSIG
jgi:hypothetical protein